ncbi:GNAT family N-acetyltransferase [Natrinema sp. H-ect1]|uniref:GNAT family N-acetyltransferase n=1 Tax=Natrinema sp. H-ect1 TaxID=3242700 RepID=UPI00359E867D
MDIERLTLEEWGDALPATGYEVFHEPDALGVLDDHTDAELQLYGAFKGQQPVGLLPVFVDERSIGRTVLSPPVSFSVPRLGPILDPASPKRHKRERINRELTAGVIDAVGVGDRTTLFRMRCPIEYVDPRPYEWNDFSLEPKFTYVLDCEGETIESLMKGFSKSLRREMRKQDELDLSIEREGIESALRVYEDVVEQYRAHDDPPPISRPFLRDLLTSLDDELWRVYVARSPDGEYQSGVVTLYSPDLAYFWQGGVTATYEGVSVNSLLHRAILEDICSDPALESVTGYDLVGANTERLCEYKAKFNSDLRQYYVVESSGLEMSLAKSAYQTFSSALK